MGFCIFCSLALGRRSQSVAARRRAPAMARGSKSDRAPAKSNEEAEETPSPAPQAADPPQEPPEAAVLVRAAFASREPPPEGLHAA